jgi:glycosyltransferase involved in cell wall biosynthesis
MKTNFFNPLISVIIPCYNQAQFLEDAVHSVVKQTYNNWEIIIVNDGSLDDTNSVSQKIIKTYSQYSITLLEQNNSGVASARNNGISVASGEYIIPLDADDKFATTYFDKAINILQNNPEIGIVYCLAEFFGSKTGLWPLREFELPDFLVENTIFCSAFFRKSDWFKVGGYSLEMKHGWEDYDFWLSLIELGTKVFRIPEVLFFYRQYPGSTTDSMSYQDYLFSYEKLYQHHKSLYDQNILVLFKRIIDHHYTIKDLYSYIQNLQVELQQIKNSQSAKLEVIPIKLGYKNIAIFITNTSEQSTLTIFNFLTTLLRCSINSLSLIFDNSCIDISEINDLITEISFYLSLQEDFDLQLGENEPILSAINLFEPTIWATISPHIDGYINLSDNPLALDNVEFIPELTIDSIERFLQNLA